MARNKLTDQRNTKQRLANTRAGALSGFPFGTF